MKTRFLTEVKNHEMTILKDDGVYRHIRFKKPETISHSFDIVTWPGYLSVSGDMGCYVFSRLNDMFEFFDTVDNKLNINFGYWTEKLKSISIFGSENGSIRIFSPEETFKNLREHLKELPPKKRQEFKEEILSSESEESAIRIMNDYGVYDSWECLSYKPTTYIQWILYAIKWGILKYNKEKPNNA